MFKNFLITYKKNIHNSTSYQIITIGIITSIIISFLWIFKVTETLELKSLDFRFRKAHNKNLVDTNIVLIAIDDNSLAYYEQNGVHWPWPREFYGLMLNYFSRVKTKAVGFDIIFTQKDLMSTDEYFALSLKKYGNAIVAAQLNVEMELEYNPIDSTKLLTINQPNFYVKEYKKVVAPLPEFQKNAKYLGIVDFKEDKDGMARKTELIYKCKDKYLLNFASALYCAGNKKSPEELANNLEKIYKTDKGFFYYYWYGKGGPDNGVFKYYTAAAIIESEIALMNNQKPIIAPSHFENKFIIVGGTSAGLHDYKSTPFTYLDNYPGMEIHATMLSNLNKNTHLNKSSDLIELTLIIFFSFLSAISYFKTKKAYLSFFHNLVLALSYLGFTILIFKYFLYWLPLVNVELTIILSFSFSAYLSYITEGQKKRFLKEAMSRYLSSQVVDIIVKNPDSIELGGDEYNGTVFFSDIKNFTTISEQYEPKQLISYLNEYLSLCTNIILENYGMLDKYIGDAIMAIFGAPINTGNHALQACKSALLIQNTLHKYYSSAENRPIFTTRIGLNSGNFILGNVGNKNRLEYTAIGDTVNLASRLEGVNKEFGTNIILSESTYELVKNSVIVRELDYIKVKGKTKPIRIYELIDLIENKNDNYDFIEPFKLGLENYRNLNFEEAIKYFTVTLKLKNDDIATKLYLKRIENLKLHGVPNNWDGVYEMTTK
ncbi:MAG TPA: adenylate/guanylate cyclase domain-containing protein [Ignavibacteriales bacterium]|nr:adenylate/guanylate cyclase domain-containing protein [Ignavibacteriales bacterium]